MYRKYLCDKCLDTGLVGFLFNKECPQCHGDPYLYFLKMHPKPKIHPPPQKCPSKKTELKNKHVINSNDAPKEKISYHGKLVRTFSRNKD